MAFFSVLPELSGLRSGEKYLGNAVDVWSNTRGLCPTSLLDGVALLVFLISFSGYFIRGRIWDKPDPNYHIYFERPQLAAGASSGKVLSTRNISERLQKDAYDCAVFWGSQSGTAERFAEALGRECLVRFGIKALVADLSDYDAESIANLERTHFAIFILSTYGEGDPSDNAAGFWDWLKQIKNGTVKLTNLRYVAFGLGNSNYKYYNQVLAVTVDALDRAGASALMVAQKADDANGGTEEDFHSWKDDLFGHFRNMGFEERTVEYQPNIGIDFADEESEIQNIPTISSAHGQCSTNSAIVPMAVKSARELFATGARNCIHMEVDIGSSGIGYKTGDHIGIWPCNPNEEVERLIEVLGLQHRRNQHLTLTSCDGSSTPKIPSPTSLAIAFRNHLEICGPVARQTVLEFAQFAPTSRAKATLLGIGQNRDHYQQFTESVHLTLARLLRLASPDEPWSNLPLTFVFEMLLPLQPRYYSVSSSSVVSPRTIAITALVVNKALPDNQATVIPGLTSNYLLSVSALPSASNPSISDHKHLGSPASPQNAQILAHIRKSKFKLPIASTTPLVLISAGTGLAPFRAFLQERARLHAIGKPIGNILMFFGCRDVNDFMYREEIEKVQAQLEDQLEVITAFSRSDSEKMYVQDRVGRHAGKVLEMLDAGANMYICGKANMAREVDAKLEEAVAVVKHLTGAEVKMWAEALKKRGKWKADVWG